MVTRNVETYHDLVVWQKSHELVVALYRAKFPQKVSESFAAKMRDSAMAIPANIALGFKKRGKKQKVHYYHVALTALQEVTYYLLLANDLKKLKNYVTISEDVEAIEGMLKRLIRSNSPTDHQQGGPRDRSQD